MALRVTNPVTKYGRYYAKGDVIDHPSATEMSLARLHQWEQVDDSAPSLGDLRKSDLLQLCQEAGLEVSGSMTKAELRGLLEAVG